MQEISYIYVIRCNITGEFYIGSTKQTLEQRLRVHQIDNKCTSKRIIERGDFNILPLEEIYDYITPLDLRKLEQTYINASRDDPLFVNNNDAYVPVDPSKNYWSEIRKLKPEVYKNYDKVRSSQRFNCPCGNRLIASNGVGHEKTIKHIKYFENNDQPDEFMDFIDEAQKGYKKKIFIPQQLPLGVAYLEDIYLPKTSSYEDFKSELACTAMRLGRYFPIESC